MVKIDARADAQHTGTFEIALELRCDPSNPGYPAGAVQITNLSMSDSNVQGTIASTSIEQLTSTGKHTPTLYVTAVAGPRGAPGCRFWLMVANNRPGDRGTPDVVSFLVFDGAGHRVAYGTGPVLRGDLEVAATPN